MLLTLRDVEKSFATADGPQPVLRGIGFDLAAGRTLALTGESGSGKSTLLHLIAGLDSPDGGTIRLDGTDIAALDDPGRAALRRGTVGLIFQQFNLIPSLDVAANLTFHARLSGRTPPDLPDLAARLGLSDHLGRYPEQLSGGQQQRVAIGRTLAARPKLVLADEPTGNLDEATGEAMMALMRDMIAETGAALLMVTHSDRLAAMLDDRLHLRAGRIAPAMRDATRTGTAGA
ncbi:MAG: ABC transporter ATP-binding protein [Pseudomonadota bacterium]